MWENLAALRSLLASSTAWNGVQALLMYLNMSSANGNAVAFMITKRPKFHEQSDTSDFKITFDVTAHEVM